MRTTINHALDIIEKDQAAPADENQQELVRVVRRVQQDYQEIIENALSLLIQDKQLECMDYLGAEREKLEGCKARIGALISEEERWTKALHRAAIEYLFTRARLVDEIRQFPNFALQLLERMTLDQSLAETINYLETAMTGKRNLYNQVVAQIPDEAND